MTIIPGPISSKNWNGSLFIKGGGWCDPLPASRVASRHAEAGLNQVAIVNVSIGKSQCSRKETTVISRRARVLAVVIVAGAAMLATTAGSAAMADGDSSSLRARLSGYQEDPLVLSTTGNGQFRANINSSAQEVSYTLSYTGLEGGVTQAHIHLGGRAQSGGIMVFLCSNLGNGPVGTQACPAAPATITGTIRPADIIGPAGQGVTAGQFGEFVAAIRVGATYVNVHSSLYPGGEIRAQLDHQLDHD